MSVHRAGSLAMAAIFMTFGLNHSAMAAGDQCVGKVPTLRVIGQPIPTIPFLDGQKGEFEKKWNTKVEIQQFGENDRRAKSRLDASQGTGAYQVYYIDEANVAEYAASKWVLPLLDYMPKDFDWNDFLEGRRAVATIGGTPYFAPFEGGGDLMMYRKDIMAEKGLKPPKNLDELKTVVAALNSPPTIYGISLRGRRGSGMNVWRWTPFFRAMGGQWFDGTKPTFNSDSGVKATQFYLDLMKDAPPGSSTNTWSEVDRRLPGRTGRSHHRKRRVRSLGGRQDEIPDRRQGGLRAAARPAAFGRFRSRLRHRGQGQPGRLLEDGVR